MTSLSTFGANLLVFIYGLGKVLPKSDLILVPFFCDLAIGTPLFWTNNKQIFMDLLEGQMQELAARVNITESNFN